MSLKRRAELARLKRKYRPDLELYKTQLVGETDDSLLRILAVLELDHSLTDAIHAVFDTMDNDKEVYGMVSLVLAKSIANLAKIAKENDKVYAETTLKKCLGLIVNELEVL